MTQIDVNTFVGAYPWRDIGPATANDLIRAIVGAGTTTAWLSNLAAVFRRDPMTGNEELYVVGNRDARLRPVPAMHPGLPGWEAQLEGAVERKVPAVRVDPIHYGLDPAGGEMRQLVAACAARGVPLMMAVRLEDLRQRHPNDRAGDLAPWMVRQLVRSDPAARFVITHADREFIEQVHFGSTPDEASRILWDICWIWGPPEDHLETLIHTIGIERFAFGTATPMRLAEVVQARIDLLNLDAASRERIASGNVTAFCARAGAS